MFKALDAMREVAIKNPELLEGISRLALELYKNNKISQEDVMSIAESYVQELTGDYGTREVHEKFNDMNQQVEVIADYMCAKVLAQSPTWVIEKYLSESRQDRDLDDVDSQLQNGGDCIDQYVGGRLPQEGLIWADVEVFRKTLRDIRNSIGKASELAMYGHFDESTSPTAFELQTCTAEIDSLLGEDND